MNLPILYTKRLMIRPLAVSDAEDMFEYAQTPLVGPKAGWAPHQNIQETIQILRSMVVFKPQYELGNWAIVDRSNHKMIGTIELYNYIPGFKAELGYALNPNYWGQGIVFEAGLKVLDYGFSVLELKRIEAGTFIDNFQSQRVCEKLGMIKEGIARNGYIRYDGIIFDKIMYGITNEEFYQHLGKLERS